MRIVIRAHRRRDEAAFRTAVTQAWLTALYHRSKKLPDLKDILSRIDRKPPRKLSKAEMIKAYEHLNAQLGGTDMRTRSESASGGQ